MRRIIVLPGSLRKASVNRRLAQVAVENAPAGVALAVFEGLAELPLYNEDIDTDRPPAAVVALREAADHADAALFVTPENNGTIPAVLKNAIDWLSRPYGAGALKGKPAAVIGAALGRTGGATAHEHTRASLSIAGTRVVDSISLSLPIRTLDGKGPDEHAEVVDAVRAVVRDLADEIGDSS